MTKPPTTKRASRKSVAPFLPPPYNRMTAEELDADVAKFDREFIADEGRPLTAAEKAQDRRARQRGRPRVGKGATKFNASVEKGLHDKAVAWGKRRNLNRSQVVAEAFRRLLARG